VPKNGFVDNLDTNRFKSLKSMKTEKLLSEREEEIRRADDSMQFSESKDTIN